MARASTVENGLAELQRVLREPDPPPPALPVYQGEIPEDLRSHLPVLSLYAAEKRAFDQVLLLIVEDLRFEYLEERAIKERLWRFVCECALHRRKGLVARFVSEHAHSVTETTCYFPVLLLTITGELELHGVRFEPRPIDDDADRQPGCAAAVPCRGTNPRRMAERSRPLAEHALRVLRASLRDYRFMPDEQLRFRLGHSMWFEGGAGGWSVPPDQGWELELDEALLRTAQQAPIYGLPAVGRNDVERRAHTALRWFELAQLVGDPLREVLFCFTALEAMLGDKSEGLKGPNLALRRAMLSLLTKDGFRHPSLTFTLYDEVRNSAVHGEEPPELSQKSVDQFAWDVRRALNEFLEFADREGFTKRSQVRKALDEHPRRQKVEAGLLREDPRVWGKFLEHASS